MADASSSISCSVKLSCSLAQLYPYLSTQYLDDLLTSSISLIHTFVLSISISRSLAQLYPYLCAQYLDHLLTSSALNSYLCVEYLDQLFTSLTLSIPLTTGKGISLFWQPASDEAGGTAMDTPCEYVSVVVMVTGDDKEAAFVEI